MFDSIREPNFDLLRRAVLREGELERVPLLELFADRAVIADVLGVPMPAPGDEVEADRWIRCRVEFWHKLGYDAMCMYAGPQLQTYTAASDDTAELPHDQRDWYQAELGILTTWDDFERYPWPQSADENYRQVELAASIMPPGMKLMGVVLGVLESIMWLMGYASFARTLYDNPALVQAICDKIDEICTPIADALLDMDAVGGLMIGDDMGFKTSTMISPDHLRKYVFPYHRKLARMAHEHGKIYVLHACGNLTAVMDDLIDDVGIDAKHSFEDVIMPIEQVKAVYGDRVGIVGGLDIDFLCRSSEDEVRQRVRNVLEANMPGGGYVLGTGNSVANYIPVRNFLAMVDEGHKWNGGTR
jgi:uroporphyrinogen decarboxylase